MLIVFDADVLIYATQAGNPLGDKVFKLFSSPANQDSTIGLGSAMLIPETLIHPARRGDAAEIDTLVALLA